MRNRNTARRRLGLAATAGIAASLVTVLTAGPAQAKTFASDTFDNPSTWSKTAVGAGSSSTVFWSGVSGSTPGSGGVGEISSTGGGFASLGKKVAFKYSDYCEDTSVSLRTTNKPATVNLEVIRPSTWRYLSLRTVKLPAYSSWQTQSFDVDSHWNEDVVFRVSVLGDNTSYSHTVNVDNFDITCKDIG